MLPTSSEYAESTPLDAPDREAVDADEGCRDRQDDDRVGRDVTDDCCDRCDSRSRSPGVGWRCAYTLDPDPALLPGVTRARERPRARDS